ncbi:MAG: domain containing protein [Gemmatimonadetes bacterium]|nr:domain containing protein [Gemmatimonadota bacterium]
MLLIRGGRGGHGVGGGSLRAPPPTAARAFATSLALALAAAGCTDATAGARTQDAPSHEEGAHEAPAGGAAVDEAGPSQGAADSTVRTPDAWSPPRVLPPGDASSTLHDARVAAFAAGTGGSLHALFLRGSEEPGRPDRLLYAAFRAGRWTEPETLDGDARRIASPRLAVDGGGRVHALWLRGPDAAHPERLSAVAHRVLAAGRWSAREAVYAGGADADLPDGGLDAAVDGAGAVHVVWPHPARGLVHLAWSAGRWRDMAPPGAAGADLRLIAGPRGALALADVMPMLGALTQSAGAYGNAWVRTAGADGAWTQPLGLHPDPARAAHAPQLAWDRRGVLHAVWLEGTPGEMLPTRLMYASTVDGRRWSAPVEAGGEAPGRAFYSPRLAVDGAGTLHLTFARFRDGVSFPRHFHASLAGTRWSAASEILPVEGERYSELETAVDSDGRLNAVWKAADGRYRHSVLTARTH